MAGLMTMGPGLGGDIAEYYKRIAAKLKGSPKMKAFDDCQSGGSCNMDNGAGYPYLLNRVFIQHSINLFFVGVQAWVAVACIAVRSRCSLLACMPPFMFDIGYWVAMDIPDIGGPAGEMQTFIVSISVILAAMDVKDAHSGVSSIEHILGMAIPILFMLVAISRKIAGLAGIMPGATDASGTSTAPVPDP